MNAPSVPIPAALEERFLRAVRQYDMLPAGTRVVVGVSGGKDSFTLLHLLGRLQAKHFPDVTFLATRIRTDITCSGSIPVEVLRAESERFGFEWEEIYFPISEESAGKVDCFYCALRRRTALIKLCFERGCDRITFGHHLDDIIETLLMNMLHHGNVSTMPPSVRLFEGRITIVRPLAFVHEEQCRDYANSQVFVPPKCRCPGLDESVRRETKELIAALADHIPDVKENLFRFLQSAAG